MNGLFFPSYWECHHPNWRTPSFFIGVGLNHQPDKDSWDPWTAFPRKLTEGLRPCPETTDDISLPSGGEIQGANWKIIILNRWIIIKHLSQWAIYTIAMSNNQRVRPIFVGPSLKVHSTWWSKLTTALEKNWKNSFSLESHTLFQYVSIKITLQ